MAAQVSAVLAERLVKLLGLMGSAHEGEALTAARLADRLVRDQLRMTWGEVILSQLSGASGPDPPRRWREPVTWQEAARLAAQWPEGLTAWERDFLVSVIRFPRPSAKQLAILDRVVRKARSTAGVREPADPTAWHPPAEPPAAPDPPTDPPQAAPGETTRADPKALSGTVTFSKRGRTRAVTDKTPRDRLLDSLAHQIAIVQLLKEGRDPKQEGKNARKMFFFDRGSYLVQITYHNQPLDLLPDADTVQVTSLDEVEEVLNGAIDLARAGHFDDQISRMAAAWSEAHRGKRGPRQREQASAEETA